MPTHVQSAYLKARSTGRFTRDEVTKKASIRELPKYMTDEGNEEG